MRHTSPILASLFVAASLFAAGQASAKPCHDASGKFIKCAATPAVTTGATRCKDVSGKFAKCSAPGAKPIAAAATTQKPASVASATIAAKPASTTPANRNEYKAALAHLSAAFYFARQSSYGGQFRSGSF